MQVNFNDVDFNQVSSNSVGYFSLKNDKDEAIVRFMHDSVDDFDIFTVHNIQVDGKYRKVNCCRTAKDDLNNCQLCSSGNNVQRRFFIKLIEYTRDQSGNIVAQPKVWERSVQWAQKLKSFIDNYGPMSDVMCKIIRHGAARSMQTEYEVVPNLSKQVYPDNIYVKDTTLFDNFKVLGTMVMDKSPQDINAFITFGVFPNDNADSQSHTDVNANSFNVYNNVPQASYPQNYTSVNNYQSPAQNYPYSQTAPQNSTPPWEQAQTPINRPQRY